jgi:hypothetical protein
MFVPGSKFKVLSMYSSGTNLIKPTRCNKQVYFRLQEFSLFL